jgi:endonuclease/exonuclease/phosphatase family metal-dependent hydrolase
MAINYKRFTKLLFIGLNLVAAISFLLTCAAPYLNPQKWWMISLMGLGFGFLIVTLIAFIFFWLVFNFRYILISLIALAVGWKAISVFFAFHNPGTFDYEKSKNVLRVAHWNVGRFVEWRRNNNKGSKTRMKMMDLIKEQNADVLCFQEFFHSKDSIYYDNLNYVMKELGYPYYYFSWDDDGYLQWVGQIIFSRYPIINKGMIRFPPPSLPEALLYADILFNKDTIRIYTTHLQSVQFKKQDFESIDRIKNTDDGMVQDSRSIFSKLKTGVVRRSLQAGIVKDVISQSPHPYILTGDFNDVPNSYTYFTIKGDSLQDIFLESGLGVGRTYTYIAPTLRIDYMFTTKDFTIRQFNRIVKNYSDHYMLVADVQLTSPYSGKPGL